MKCVCTIKRVLPVIFLSFMCSGLQAQEGMFMKDALGSIGLIAPEAPPIEYRERSPLVLPPKMELRTPVDSNAIQARNPNWPNDPDVMARRAAAKEARIPVTERESRRALENNPRLSIQEIQSGRKAGAEIVNSPVYRPGDSAREGTWIHPDKLRSEGILREKTGPEDVASRRSLTDPPSTFRQEAARVKQKATNDPVYREDEADPRAYQRQQLKGRE